MVTTKLDCLGLSVSFNPNCYHKKEQSPSMPVNQEERVSNCPPTETGHKQMETMILPFLDLIEICVAWHRFYFWLEIIK